MVHEDDVSFRVSLTQEEPIRFVSMARILERTVQG